MVAPKGTRFWEVCSSRGRKPIFANPQELWDACVEYFDWNEEHPLQETQAFAYQGEVSLQELPKMRAMTLAGLSLFLDIDETTWREYKKREVFTPVCKAVEQVMYHQKFSGAAGGFLNASIIARDLGLVDKVASEHTGAGGGPIKAAAIIMGTQDPNEAAKAYKELMDNKDD